jgi:hypothetical protein
MTPKQKRLQKLKRHNTIKSFTYYLIGALITGIILAIIGVNL